jgi:hypothetical protein
MAEDEDQQIAAVLAKLAGQDAAAVEDARAALEWIAGDQGLVFITQQRIQNFCWYDLPVKWLIDLDDKLRVVAALAQALDLLQLPRYAAVCRSRTTREVLSAYETGLAQGKAAFRRAAAASGVMPPDLPGFQWGPAMASRRLRRGRRPPSSSRSPCPAAIWSRGGGAGRRASRNLSGRTSTSRRPGCSGRRWPR